MKTHREIEQDLITTFIAEQDEVTYFGKGSKIRGLFSAIGRTLNEIWNDLYQMKRKSQLETATGSDLDTHASRTNLTRLTASKSSTVVIINGTAGTVIPKDTVIKSSLSGQSFKTTKEITLGNNANLQRPILSNTLGDTVIVESVDTGSKTRIGVKELTVFETPIQGVTAINLVPSVGGQDEETDEQLRERIKSYPATLAQGNQVFFEGLARLVEPTVLKTIAVYDPTTGGTKLYVCKNSMANYEQAELTSIAEQIYAKQRALLPVTCSNVTFKEITVSFSYTRDTNITQETIFADLATRLSDYVNVDKFGFASTIRYTDVVRIVLETTGILSVDLEWMLLSDKQENVNCGSYELPKFTSLQISDGTAKESTINQQYTIL